jgi:hypothetical protein
LNIDTLLQKHTNDYNDDDATNATDDDDASDASDATDASNASNATDSSDSCIESDSSPPVKDRTHPSVKDSDYAVDSDNDLLQSVLDEPTFPLDVNAILSAMNKTDNNTIANTTLKKIHARRHEILASMNLTPEKLAEFERKLHMYRVIENPYDLKHNQLHIVTIRNIKRFVFNIRFELNVVFQRLSQEELLILRVLEYLDADAGDAGDT